MSAGRRPGRQMGVLGWLVTSATPAHISHLTLPSPGRPHHHHHTYTQLVCWSPSHNKPSWGTSHLHAPHLLSCACCQKGCDRRLLSHFCLAGSGVCSWHSASQKARLSLLPLSSALQHLLCSLLWEPSCKTEHHVFLSKNTQPSSASSSPPSHQFTLAFHPGLCFLVNTPQV